MAPTDNFVRRTHNGQLEKWSLTQCLKGKQKLPVVAISCLILLYNCQAIPSISAYTWYILLEIVNWGINVVINGGWCYIHSEASVHDWLKDQYSQPQTLPSGGGYKHILGYKLQLWRLQSHWWDTVCYTFSGGRLSLDWKMFIVSHF